MRNFLFLCMILFSSGVFAAPIMGNYPSAPRATPAEARQKVIDAGKKYLGTPYVYGAMSSSGTDCSGFVCMSFKDALGETLPRSAAGLHSWADKIALNRAQPGDLLFFRTGTTSAITHVGIFLGDKRFIHAASDGAHTGVIYSTLDETYWDKAFVTAGRALPAAPSNFKVDSGSSSGTGDRSDTGKSKKLSGNSIFLIGAAAAPTWDFFSLDGDVLRGFASTVSINFEFSKWLSFGFEIRPEYDDSLHVFRLPFTLSWGHKDIFRIFFGPVVSFGDSALTYKGANYSYYGGTTWIGTVGISVAPYTFKIKNHDLAPYIEAAWQSYFPNDKNSPLAADFIAGFRFSTGLRWRMRL
ncbi:MAG: C40 family peptidase [Treponema sp.]|nr:C40 family peptidase [Treponema sp.]